MSAPSHTKPAIDPEKLEVAPGIVHQTVQGWIPELASDEDVRQALETAFDYRGDVTLTCKDGSQTEGYIFDRVSGATLGSSYVRIMPSNGAPRQKIAYANIRSLAFSGRDSAAGKSWEAWVRKYWEKKDVGGSAPMLEPEPLD
jgi:hypothetical protein